MHRGSGLIALLLATILVGTASSAALSAVLAAVPAAAQTDVAAADNAFGFQLLTLVQKANPGGNVVLSPVSAALNLSMVLDGAKGQTRDEILTVLSLSGSDVKSTDAANEQLMKLIRTPAESVDLSVASSLWVDQRRATLRTDYVKRVKAAYDAEVAELDFSDANATRRINQWADQQTRGKIPKVIDRIDPVDLLLLLNAVYFKGEWTHKFDKAKTQQREFTPDGGTAKQVPRMMQTGRFDYFETAQIQAIRLPFGTGDLNLQVLLPAKSSSLSALESQLTSAHWKEWQGQYGARPGTVELPRFELKSSYHLNGPLQAMGMKSAFSPTTAQLTDMVNSADAHAHPGRLSISEVLQSTYWKVDEEGAEAAAVTTTGIRATAVAHPEQPFQMIVDRPFFCVIQDQRSGALLFIGAIHDPTG